MRPQELINPALLAKRRRYPELQIPGIKVLHDYQRNASILGHAKATDELNFTRASAGTYKNGGGQYIDFASNEPRIGTSGLLLEELRTNAITNSNGGGAVAGTPGTLPTNWGSFTGGGVSREVVGSGEEYGLNYVDIRFFGTAASSSGCAVYFDNTSNIVAADGEEWNFSTRVKLVGGSLNDLSPIRGNVIELNSGGSVVQVNYNIIPDHTPDETFQELTGSVTLSGGGTVTAIRPAYEMVFSSGAVVDVTLRLYQPQLEKGTITSAPIKTSGTAATRQADAASISPISSFYTSGDEFTIFAYAKKVESDEDADIRGLIGLSDGTTNNRASFRITQSGRISVIVARAGAISVNSTHLVGDTDNTKLHKYALRVKENDFAAYVDGVEIFNDTTGQVPINLDRFLIGRAAFGEEAGVYMHRAGYFNRGLSNKEMSFLTRV